MHVHQPGIEPVNDATTEEAAILDDPVVYPEFEGEDEFEAYASGFYRQVALDTMRRLNGPLRTRLQELRYSYQTASMASQKFVDLDAMGRQVQSMTGWLRRLAGRRYLLDGSFGWPGPHWHEVLPLYRDLQMFEDLVDDVTGAVRLEQPRFSLLFALNSLECAHHLENDDGQKEDEPQSQSSSLLLPKPQSPSSSMPGAQEIAKEKKKKKAIWKANKQQKADATTMEHHCQRHYYFVDAGDQGDSIAAPMIQSIFDEVIN